MITNAELRKVSMGEWRESVMPDMLRQLSRSAQRSLEWMAMSATVSRRGLSCYPAFGAGALQQPLLQFLLHCRMNLSDANTGQTLRTGPGQLSFGFDGPG